jgi:hypothetical protein
LLLTQGGLSLGAQNPTPGTLFVGLTALAAGAMLSVGFLTPIVGTLVGLGGLGIGFSFLPACTPCLFDSKLPVLESAAMLIAIILLGPGAFSVDCRVFGRREIIIPPASKMNFPAVRENSSNS